MKMINKFFWKGIIVVMPITITIYVLLIILNKAENLFGNFVKNLIGPSFYVPGFGIILTIGLMVLVGILVSNLITGSVINFFINQFEKFPVIKAIYNPLRDLMTLFGGGGHENMKKVVLVNFDKIGFRAIGLVTREEFDDLPEGTLRPDTIAVYVPMSYMLGGFTMLVPRESVEQVDIPVERAFKLALTGWIKADKNAF